MQKYTETAQLYLHEACDEYICYPPLVCGYPRCLHVHDHADDEIHMWRRPLQTVSKCLRCMKIWFPIKLYIRVNSCLVKFIKDNGAKTTTVTSSDCDVSNHWPHDCLFNTISNLTVDKTAKLQITGPVWGEPPTTNGFHSRWTSNVKVRYDFITIMENSNMHYFILSLQSFAKHFQRKQKSSFTAFDIKTIYVQWFDAPIQLTLKHLW